MAVYVDALFKVSRAMVTGYWPCRSACHMTADTHDELEAMARRMNLDPNWIQHRGRPTEHYDLTPHMRAIAIKKGAVCR